VIIARLWRNKDTLFVSNTLNVVTIYYYKYIVNRRLEYPGKLIVVDVCYVELPSELWKNSATQYQEEERGLKVYMCCLLVGLQLL
jgi:hypothetical protein